MHPLSNSRWLKCNQDNQLLHVAVEVSDVVELAADAVELAQEDAERKRRRSGSQ